jgi:hypothetical protein
MKKTTRNRIWAASILAGFLGACALPMSSTPTQFVFPTPNLTMTALFQIPPTATTGVEPTAKPTTLSVSATPSVTLSPTALNCTNKVQFVSETVGDLTYIAPGTAFTKTWSLKNIGTCTWGAGYALVFDSGDQMGGPASVPLTASVPPNALYNFTVNLTAPATGGQFQGFWKLQTPQGVKFGLEVSGMNSFWVTITTVPLAPACNAQSKRPDANGSLVEGYAMTPGSPVVIDGVLSEWDPLIYSANNVVFGSTGNTAKFSLKWDSEYLYLAVQVTDSSFNQNSSGGADLYKGDSVEFLLDTNLKGDYCDTGMSSDDYQFGISPGNTLTPVENPTSWLWYPLSKAGAKVISTASTAVAGGWIMESRIPWNIFGITPSGSEYYGFAFSVSNDDHADKVQQDSMISTDPKRAYPSNPTLWGTLEVEVKTGP